MGLDGVDDVDETSAASSDGTAATVRVWTMPSELATLREALGTHTLVNACSLYMPLNPVAVADAEARAAHDATVDALRALDDVEDVWTNASAREDE